MRAALLALALVTMPTQAAPPPSPIDCQRFARLAARTLDALTSHLVFMQELDLREVAREGGRMGLAAARVQTARQDALPKLAEYIRAMQDMGREAQACASRKT